MENNIGALIQGTCFGLFVLGYNMISNIDKLLQQWKSIKHTVSNFSKKEHTFLLNLNILDFRILAKNAIIMAWNILCEQTSCTLSHYVMCFASYLFSSNFC